MNWKTVCLLSTLVIAAGTTICHAEMRSMANCSVVTVGAYSPERLPDGLMAKLSDLAFRSDQLDLRKHIESLTALILANPAQASEELVRHLKQGVESDTMAATIVWALGISRDSSSASEIIKVTQHTSNTFVRQHSFRALASIGGSAAKQYLVQRLLVTDDSSVQDELVPLLATLKCPEVLPFAAKTLEKPYATSYWQSLLTFGPMGDAAIPFLIERISSPDTNVRMHAITILGAWLMAPTAEISLRTQYAVEANPKIRIAILSSLERVCPTIESLLRFAESSLATEPHPEVRKYLEEISSFKSTLHADLETFRSQKDPDQTQFDEEFNLLYRSSGRKGSIKRLAVLSRYEDEPRLNSLREVIFGRQSDECLHDVMNLNRIILFNRYLAKE